MKYFWTIAAQHLGTAGAWHCNVYAYYECLISWQFIAELSHWWIYYNLDNKEVSRLNWRRTDWQDFLLECKIDILKFIKFPFTR